MTPPPDGAGPASPAAAAYLVAAAARALGLLVGTAVAPPARRWPPLAWCRSRRQLGGWLAIDALGLLVLSLVSVLFLVVAVYAVGFLRTEPPRGGRVFVSGLLGVPRRGDPGRREPSPGAAVGRAWRRRRSRSRRWCTTGTTAARSRRSGSTSCCRPSGIALALLGTFFLAAAQTAGRPLLLEDLIAGRGSLQPGAAADRVRVPPGRLRHQDGTGAAARVEARHLRRGAQPGRGAHGGRADELRVPRARAHHRDHDGRRPGGVRAAAARLRSAWCRWSSRRPS